MYQIPEFENQGISSISGCDFITTFSEMMLVFSNDRPKDQNMFDSNECSDLKQCNRFCKCRYLPFLGGNVVVNHHNMTISGCED